MVIFSYHVSSRFLYILEMRGLTEYHVVLFLWSLMISCMMWRGLTKFWLTRLVGVSKRIGYLEAIVWVGAGLYTATNLIGTFLNDTYQGMGRTGYTTLAVWSVFFTTLAVTSHMQLRGALRAHEEMKNELRDTINIRQRG